MNDELYDEKAYVCTDCLVLIANGDGPDFAYQYPDKTEAEITDMEVDYYARIETAMHGFNITCGWGREQHDCATNITVTPLFESDDDARGRCVYPEEPIQWANGDEKGYRADTISDAIGQAEFDFPSAIGFKGVMHDLETQGDIGGECDCETLSFSEQNCAHCDDRYVGTWHAATIWKITEGKK
jgi:hypothetical protein